MIREHQFIERRAQRLLRFCCRKLNLTSIPFPVPVDAWIEHPLGFQFSIEDLEHLGVHVLGAVFVADREIAISDKIYDNESRFRFTAAHELGHMILHTKIASTFRDTAVGNSTQPIEREADRFATAFLMPLDQFTESIFLTLDEHRLDRRGCLIELFKAEAPADWLWRKRLFPALTRRFGVSLSTALYRASDILLPDGSPLLNSEYIQRLLVPADAQDAVHRVRIVNRVPHA